MRSNIKNYMGMVAIAIVVVLVIGAVGVRIDRDQQQQAPSGITATPAIGGNAPGGLVDARWLTQYGSQVDYIFDLSDVRQYEAGHIPGAIHLWWQDAMALHAANYAEPDFFTMNAGGDPIFDKFNLHIPQNSRIVLYDSNNSERASWLLWVLTINGFTDAHVLDGGLPAWIGAGGEISTEVVDERDLSLVATPTRNEEVLVRREAILENLDDPDFRIVDARSAEEQEDTVNGTIRKGHIPGSINIPTAEVMRGDGTFKSPEELRSLFEARGISPDHDIVVYSLFSAGSGNVWLALQIAGYENVSIYMEGFVAWGYNVDLPLESDPYPSQVPLATPDPGPRRTPTAEPAATPTSTPENDGPTDLTGD